ncbi:MAG: DUF935 family protein [Verrucomicrobia bacterium]|nr:DUF935 family protein [Verrucomicrobiota bacterium]
MPTIKERIAQYFRELLPVRTVTRFDPRSITAALAHTLTVDDVAAIFREAEACDPTRLFALYRDIILAHSHLQSQLSTRKLAVLGDVLNVKPFDKSNAADVAVAEALRGIKFHPDWQRACSHLLDAVLWPVAVVEKVYRPSTTPGLNYELARLVPVPHELLDFRDGSLKIKDTDELGNPASTTHDPSPFRYIVHRGHLLTTPDYWGGPMRSLVLWWLLGTMTREWWARFLDRYGAPFVVGKYPSGDDDSRGVLQTAFAWACKIGGLVVTSETDVEIKQAAASDAGDAFEKFHGICNREISKLILGQTITADAQATGLGSGVANAQEGVRQDIRQFDAMTLGAAFTTQLAAQFVAINRLAGKPPLFVWGTISPAELQAMGEFLTALKTAALRVSDASLEVLSERGGLTLERDPAPADSFPGLPGLQPHAAPGILAIDQAHDIIARNAAATLSHTLGRHFAPIRQIILAAESPAAAIAGVESYCAKFEPGEAARIIEESLLAYAANGSVVHARP